jgi:hypothetical protein
MAEAARTYDVFISYSPKHAALALEVAGFCRDDGLEAFTDAEIRRSEDWGDAIWEALAESRALLAIVSPEDPTPAMAIEIGAAKAWNKPIYAIVTDPSSNRLAPALAGIPLYTAGRLPDVINSIRASVEELSDDDRVYLGKLYSQMRVSVDQLALDPVNLDRLCRKFSETRGKVVAGDRLLSELFRLRKQNRLLRRPGNRRSPKREPA